MSDQTAAVDQPVRVDGRAQRTEHTRRAIVDAHLALLAEGHLKTSAGRIAERAGVSLRAVDQLQGHGDVVRGRGAAPARTAAAGLPSGRSWV